ncbi:MAG: DUF4169 family protein [Parvibaculum sp.]
MDSDDGNIVKIAQFRKIARQDKKDRARKEKEATAAANRVRFGRTGNEKRLTRRLNDMDAKAHDALHLDRPVSSDTNKKSDDENGPKDS